MAYGIFTQRDRDRFFAKTRRNPETGCLEWTAGLSRKGYGHFTVGHRNLQAHRAAWEMARGRIESGLFVCHACDNPRCVEISHLFTGTHAENMADGVRKGRFRPGRPARLSEDDVRALRAVPPGTLTVRALAVRFGVGKTTIGDVLRRVTWRRVE